MSERNNETFEETPNCLVDNIGKELGKYCLMACLEGVKLGQEFENYPEKHITILPPFYMDDEQKAYFNREFSKRNIDQGDYFVDSYLKNCDEKFGDDNDIPVFRLFPAPLEIYGRASFLVDLIGINRDKKYGIKYHNVKPVDDVSVLFDNMPKPHVVQQDGLYEGQHIKLKEIQLFESKNIGKIVCSIYNSDGSYESI